ncbi:phenylalanine--tRNA ligase subunit beta [candidate division KSB1 bacterium]|nr:phenylalanine--tRNA ligase subunit beta [candidate division KSB1 bacterium]
MKVTVSWLKKYVDFSYAPDDLAHRLTMLGLEVEGVKQVVYDFTNVVIGKITGIEKHHQNKQLSICQVDVGNESLSLVCGAPNVSLELKVPVALVGAKLPGDVTVEAATIHGYDSPGMICSEAELGLSNQSEIVMELSEDAEIGKDLQSYLGEGETVIEIDVTPNRPDCLGIIGVAREIAAITGEKLRKPEININESSSKEIKEVINVTIKNPESCPRYTARYIEGIKVGPSPRWLIQKLEAVSIRTINNIVDITNYVMMETGQPLHAFDYDLLENQEIIVRHASQGEKFTTLDEKEHTLTDKNLFICDGKKPIALAGVMGGLNSEISANTTNVLLESASFEPLNIRRTAKSLSISTDSSQRFERGVDPEGMVYANNRATQLINELAGGEVYGDVLDCFPRPAKNREIKITVESVNNLLGTTLVADEVVDIFNKLEFKSKKENGFIEVEVPSFRVDIEREVDLIEEVSRIYGFDRVESNNFSNIPLFRIPKNEEKFNQITRDQITRLGYNEIITHSLINQKLAEDFTTKNTIKLANPISEDLATLRTSILPGALQVLKWNKNRKISDHQLFEIGNIFYLENKDLSTRKEYKKIALIKTGNVGKNSWLNKSRVSTFYDFKGDVLSFLGSLGIFNINSALANLKFLNEDESVNLFCDETEIGFMGNLSQSILKKLDIEGDIYVAELDFDTLFRKYNWDKKSQQVPKFPAVQRDLAIVVNQTIKWEQVEKYIWEISDDLLMSIELFDLYRGKQIEQDQKSFAFTLTYQSNEHTLIEKEIESAISKVLENLKSKINANLRA